MAIKCILCYLFMALFISTISCTVSEGQKQHTEEDNPENTLENMKDFIAHELKQLQKIIFEFQNTMTSKMETITVLEDNLNHKMKEITNNIFTEQTLNITKQITGKINAAFKANGMLITSTENINNRLVRIEYELQNSIVTKLDEIAGLDDAINRQVKDIANNILLDQTMNITKQISDKIYSTLKKHNVRESTEQINRRLASIETIQNSVNMKLEKIETGCGSKINTLIEKTEQLTDKLIKTGSPHKEQSTLELLENMITSKLAAMKDDLQMNMFKKLEILENNINVLTTNIKQQNEKDCVYKEQTVPVTVEQVNSRLVALDNITKLEEHSMQNLINISEQIQASVDKLNQQTDYLKNETAITKICNLNQEARESIKNIVLDQTKYITQQVINNVSFVSKQNETKLGTTSILNKRKENTTQATNQTTEASTNSSNHLQHCGTGTEPDKLFSWCGSLPNTVNIRDDIWQDDQVPGEDDLDKFLVNTTGCTYRAVKYNRGFYLPDVRYDGTLYEWGVSVRAGDSVYMGVKWDGGWRYGFHIGYHNNTYSSAYDRTTYTNHPLPAVLLSRSRYERFYVRLQPGGVTFGRECDSAPLYTSTSHPTVAGGTTVRMLLYSGSQYGAKFLYNCPAVTGNTRTSHVAHTTASSGTN